MIVFDARNCGLGPNGGSRTIIKCCETLNKLGYKSEILSNIDNFKWFSHRPIIKSIPNNTEVLVAVSSKDVKNVINSKIKKKVWYVRGFESWQTNENKLIDLFKQENILKIVNSNGLQKKLESFGVESHVVYQGVDLDFWKDLGVRNDKKIRIGCLYNPRHKTKHWDHFQYIAKRLDKKKYEFVGFGTSKSKDDFLSDFITNPTEKDLRNFYNTCHIWFSPTTNEGLHNVSMEAALCGCLIVCNDHPDNGMIYDYAFKNKTAMVYNKLDEVISLLLTPDYTLINSMKDHIKTVINNREHNMKKFVDIVKK